MKKIRFDRIFAILSLTFFTAVALEANNQVDKLDNNNKELEKKVIQLSKEKEENTKTIDNLLKQIGELEEKISK